MKALLEKIKNLRVLVVGDAMLDHYVWGDVTRVSPEAPVPVVRVESDSYVAGGAANVALNAASFGAEVILCGWIGRDEPGDRLAAVLGERGVKFDEAFRRSDCGTICKSRIMARNQQLCRVDRELLPEAYALNSERDREPIDARLAEADAVILSDYGKGFVDNALIERMLTKRASSKTIVALDPKPRRRLRHEGIDLLTPNRTEALELAGLDKEGGGTFPADRVCSLIHERHAPRYLAVTLGARGMLLSEGGELGETIPTAAREVFDVSGAGDTVISTLTLALAAGASFREAAVLSNAAAGLVVGKVGTATTEPEEILAYLEKS
ncbi:MAG: PfkB family carbohydrate kinase [Opitutales bacterium]